MPKPADLVLLGEPTVAVREGRVIACGPRYSVLDFIAESTRVLDLDEARLYPGLRDAHAHLVPTGLFRQRLDLRGLGLGEIRDAVAERVQTAPPGSWILGAGFTLDDLALGREPTAADLDNVSPDHPVRLSSHDLHANWVNTRALLAAGRSADAPAYFTEDEIRIFTNTVGGESPEERLEAIRTATRQFHEVGITEIQDHGRLDDLLAILALAETGELRLRVRFSIRDHELAEYLEMAGSLPRFPGLVEVNGQKCFLDGALTSRTAWTLEPYEGSDVTGHRALTPEEGEERIRFAAARGMPTFFHAIGDAAVREALRLCRTARGLPHRVEHAQLIHPKDIPAFAELGVVASVQPVHLLSDTTILPELWGAERARQSFPVKSLLRAGAEVVLGSDTPIETPDPMAGVFAAVTRRTLMGDELPGDETVDAATALGLYLSRPEIEVGMPADLVVYERDPVELAPEELPGTTPVLTVFAGEVVSPLRT